MQLEYLAINIYKGLFKYTRMPFRVASAPSIFQRTMDNLLQRLEHVVVYIDDILITGCTEEDSGKDVTDSGKAGMFLKKGKFVFMVPSVEYLALARKSSNQLLTK